MPLASAGKAALQAKVPLELNVWRAPEVLHGPPLGDSAVREPLEEVRERQLRWLQLVTNLPGLVGTVHRVAAWRPRTGTWKEPSAALESAAQAVGRTT